ncbi:hypothetical protein [Streptomyces sp. cmx-18-6]|uniref:hypothetical protein n=1 Tax=Streptomyces sp. cmx-18-6 TaxID=2790930 RepID=UPI00397FF0F9
MKKIFSLVAGTAVVTGSLFLAAPAASAKPICVLSKSTTAPYKAFVRCSGMLSNQRAVVYADCVDPRGKTWTVAGKRVKNGQESVAQCSDSPNVGMTKISHKVVTL